MIVDVIDGYQLRCTDQINWQVFELKEVKRKENRNYTGVVEEDWVGLQSFHATIESGVEWISRRIPKNAKNREARKSLDQFLEDMKKTRLSISRAATKLDKAVMNGEVSSGE